LGPREVQFQSSNIASETYNDLLKIYASQYKYLMFLVLSVSVIKKAESYLLEKTNMREK
jgi:hypothetical protein